MAIKPVPTAIYRQTVVDMIREEQSEQVVEVGVHGGGLSRLIAELSCVKMLWLVDPWVRYKHYTEEYMEDRYREVRQWASTRPNVTVMRMTSAGAQGQFAKHSIDFFHTDGDHRYESVLLDIRCWRDKIRPGGLLTGDNYEYHEIARAVDEMLPERELVAKGRIFVARM